LIDPAPFWDDDGKAYLVHAYAGSRAGIKHLLRVCPMAPNCSQILGEGEIVYNNPAKHPTLEGPKLHKRNGWYYISAPAGGVQNGWQVILRSRSIYGPYEDKIVLAQGNSNINGPHQGALVDTPQGDWWFVHFQDADVYGRIIHLQPVRWEDDWPLIGINQNENGVGEPVMEYKKPAAGDICIPQTSDDFQSPELGLQWQWNANHYDDWYSLSENPGHLRLYPQNANPDIRLQPNLLLQKFPARSFSVETKLELHAKSVGESAGLVIAGETQFMLGLENAGEKNLIVLNINNEKQILAETQKSQLTLKAKVSSGGQFALSYSVDDTFISLPQIFQATKGTWIGARIGLYSIKSEDILQAGYSELKYFLFS
jgi:beta-xylosidase